MALFDDDDDGNSSHETSSHTCQFQARGNFLNEYGVSRSYTFRSLHAFKEDYMGFYAEMEEGNMEGETQYLGFTHVSMSDIVEIDEIRRQLPKMRIFYDMNEEILIVKVTVDKTHGICGGLVASEFDRLVFLRTGLRRSIVPMGSSRCSGLRRMKEVDHSFKPSSRGLTSDWPSVVLEVGVFEGLRQLHLDARFWLECSGGQTRVVILACLNKATRALEIQRWQDDPGAPRRQPIRNVGVPNPYARRHVATLMQSLTLEEGQVYVGASLIILAALVYDVLPPIQGVAFGPSDFELTTQDLNDLNEVLWGALG